MEKLGAELALTPSPIAEDKLWDKVRRDFFATRGQTVLTSACLAVVLLLAWRLFNWAVIDAVWTGTPETCLKASGACWAVIADRYRLIFFGLYPYELQRRSALACLAILLTVILSCIPFFWSIRRIPAVWVASAAQIAPPIAPAFLPKRRDRGTEATSPTIRTTSAAAMKARPILTDGMTTPRFET
jgi:hypothetical protein